MSETFLLKEADDLAACLTHRDDKALAHMNAANIIEWSEEVVSLGKTLQKIQDILDSASGRSLLQWLEENKTDWQPIAGPEGQQAYEDKKLQISALEQSEQRLSYVIKCKREGIEMAHKSQDLLRHCK